MPHSGARFWASGVHPRHGVARNDNWRGSGWENSRQIKDLAHRHRECGIHPAHGWCEGWSRGPRIETIEKLQLDNRLARWALPVFGQVFV